MEIGKNPSILYLDIMKKSLSFSLWQEPGIPIETFNYTRSRFKIFCINILSSILRKKQYQIVTIPIPDCDKKELGMLWWSTHAETMIGLKRLENIQFCVENIIKDKIQGDLIETGVWRGGSCIFMRAILAAYGITDRLVFVADSFEGVPKPDEKRYPQDKGDMLYLEKLLAVSEEEVTANFKKYDLLDNQVVFLKGWFNETLPIAPIDNLALMRLDGDMYQSTIESLKYLYTKLSVGGYCIIDDYALKGCKQAVDDFRRQNMITTPIQQIDWTGIYWRKE